MPNREHRIECWKCGHAWTVDLDELDERDQAIYKGDEPREYRVRCPRCHTKNVFQAPGDP
jgi:hypothetical protein